MDRDTNQARRLAERTNLHTLLALRNFAVNTRQDYLYVKLRWDFQVEISLRLSGESGESPTMLVKAKKRSIYNGDECVTCAKLLWGALTDSGP